MCEARVLIDSNFQVGVPDPRLFGSFVEHLGRCVYGGIYEPGHSTADENGFRSDVLKLVRELGVTVVRYPGGNFVSGYQWEDGVGPQEKRPVRRDLAWFSTETNQFGTNEFMVWCREAGVEPMMAVNLGTRGAAHALEYLEYCNVASGTARAEWRAEHGYVEPHAIALWCLGNEMDAPWQIGAKTAAEYGELARETAKLMKWLDPSVELIVCGSSGPDMPTFGRWEDTVLEHAFDHVEYISLHSYFSKYGSDTAGFIAQADQIGQSIDEIVAVADAVAARKRSSKRIMVSFDEWNVWYRTRDRNTRTRPGWPEAPAILEELFTMEDTVVFCSALLNLLNRCDRVRIACLAQLVNVIAPIMTESGGPAWRQPIFHPFKDVSKWGRGTVLDARIESTCFQTKEGKELPHLAASCVLDEAGRTLTLFCVNRNMDGPLELKLECCNLSIKSYAEGWLLNHHDPSATNTGENPDNVSPTGFSSVAIDHGTIAATLPPASWVVLRFVVA